MILNKPQFSKFKRFNNAAVHFAIIYINLFNTKVIFLLNLHVTNIAQSNLFEINDIVKIKSIINV